MLTLRASQIKIIPIINIKNIAFRKCGVSLKKAFNLKIAKFPFGGI